VKPDQVHELVHRDPITAWPHVIALVEADGAKAHELGLLADLVYSEELPELIDRIEEQARRSKRFRFALLSCGDELGGRGGPEMERIFKLVQDAEAELATVVNYEDERELRSVRSLGRTLRAMIGRKILIYKRKPRTDRDRR